MKNISEIVTIMMLCQITLISGCKEVKPASPMCCCGVEGGGIRIWERKGYFCANLDSLIDCTSKIETYLSGQSCPLIFPGFKSADILVPALPNPPADSALPLNCRKECDQNSAYCLKAILDAAQLSLPTQKLLNAIYQAENGVIEKSQIMEFYDVSIDPCGRSDLTVDGKVLSNSGQQCYFGKSFELIDTVNLGIALPKAFEFAIELIGTDSGSFVATQTSTSVVLKFDDKYLQADFGGPIESVRYDKGTFLVQTSNGCVQVTGDSK